MFEDTKGAIRSHTSKKGEQHIGQKKKDKTTNNDIQNITQKTKYSLIYSPTLFPLSKSIGV